MSEDFISFNKIGQFGKLYMSVTEKIHGSNAQIYIYKDDNGEFKLKTGSRTRWIVPGDDNYGFARFVYDNKQEFIEKLGEGRHFGEWMGSGINSGYGLKEKRFYLFNWRRWGKVELPVNTFTVPLIYTGNFCLEKIALIMEELKQTGSKAVDGFNRPEGIVIEIDGKFYKKTFDTEEVSWTQGTKEKTYASREKPIDVSNLLQPMRLEKLLSRDSRYLERYPETLPLICKDYVKDLEEENQFNCEADEIIGIKKILARPLFNFVKTKISELEEQELMDSVERGEWKTIDNLEEEKRIAKEAADNWIKKNQC